MPRHNRHVLQHHQIVLVKEAVSLVQAETKAIIAGGSQVYKQGLNIADSLVITHIEQEFPLADTFFPVIDDKVWKHVKSELGSLYHINTYVRR